MAGSCLRNVWDIGGQRPWEDPDDPVPMTRWYTKGSPPRNAIGLLAIQKKNAPGMTNIAMGSHGLYIHSLDEMMDDRWSRCVICPGRSDPTGATTSRTPMPWSMSSTARTAGGWKKVARTAGKWPRREFYGRSCLFLLVYLTWLEEIWWNMASNFNNGPLLFMNMCRWVSPSSASSSPLKASQTKCTRC